MRLRFSIALLVCCASVRASEPTDIIVEDQVKVQRSILPGPSTRMIAVGHPGGFNYTFDAVHCAPDYAWFGDFIDFRGETTGRGGRHSQILGVTYPLCRTHKKPHIPIRVDSPKTPPSEIKFSGYLRDPQTGAPTFQFRIDGLAIEQTLTSTAKHTVDIQLTFPEPSDSEIWYLIDQSIHKNITLSDGLDWADSKTIKIPANTSQAKIRLQLKPKRQSFTRKRATLTGEELFTRFCQSCHSTDGTKLIGPTFKHLWERQQTVTRDGTQLTITVDEDYLHESIVNPQAAIVKGYEQVPMANFSDALTPGDIQRLVSYLKTLR